MPSPEPRIVDIVVGHERSTGSKCGRGKPLALVRMLVGRAYRCAKDVGSRSGAGNESQLIFRRRHQNAGAEQLAAEHGSIANSLKQLVLGCGPQDRRVRGAEGRKHPRKIRLQDHRFPLAALLHPDAQCARWGLSGGNELESMVGESIATTRCKRIEEPRKNTENDAGAGVD